MSAPVLEVSGLRSGYGDTQVLHGIDLAVPPGGGVAVLGRNGMGKTTLLETVMGLVPATSGSIRLDGVEMAGAPAHRLARAGLRLVPQGRRMFTSLTVAETLAISQTGPAGSWTIERVYDSFPSLARRRGNRTHHLSGGEQEMLAIARGLLGNPRCLLLDEPSDGLAPKVVEQISEIIVSLRAEGLAVVLVEQNLRLAVAAAEHVYCVVRGAIAWDGSTAAFRSRRDVAETHLGVGV